MQPDVERQRQSGVWVAPLTVALMMDAGAGPAAVVEAARVALILVSMLLILRDLRAETGSRA